MRAIPRYSFIYSLTIIVGTILIATKPVAADAATRIVNCDRFSDPARLENRLNFMLRVLNRGDILRVQGTCNANLTIQEGVNDITLEGQEGASFVGPDTDRDVIRVEGRGIIIKGLDIQGGRDGIHVHWGGVAQEREAYGIENNEIHNVGRNGLAVHGSSSTRILNNHIYNAQWGIYVYENSSIRIGNRHLEDTPDPDGHDTIEQNAKGGIRIERSSTAHIVGATIRDNEGGIGDGNGVGVLVRKGSHATLHHNTITGNDSHGIQVNNSTIGAHFNEINNNGGNAVTIRKNGHASLSDNTTTSNNNTGYAVHCKIGGVVDGELDGLTGNAGQLDVDGSCVEALSDI